ncbi:MAG: FkbM family methyltransferase [Gemmatimonadota bacterium]|nr:FkbM family methyltransferase [Gemmatimonadota bacterium]
MPFGLKVAIAKHLFPNLGRYLPPGREVTVDDYLGEFRAVVDTTYPVEIGVLIDRYEPDTLRVIGALVREGDVCLDIGANVGAVTMAMARRVGVAGKVYAFEPGPDPYARLVRNVALNPSIRDRVVTLQMGVSSEPGTLYWNADERGNPANATLLSGTGTPTTVVSVDTFVAETGLDRVDFVKIDVEGMEYEVLRGGLATWRAYQPVFYLETERRFEAIRGFPALERIERLFDEIGYRLYRMDKRGRLEAVTAATMAASTLAAPLTHRTVAAGSVLGAAVGRSAAVRARPS